MKNKINPCIWCNNNAKEMADFYADVFPNTKITAENAAIVSIEISGQTLMLLNGGAQFQPNPAVSFMYMTPGAALIDKLYEKLSPGGKILMEKNAYAWSENYVWLDDKYGVSWQLYHGPEEYCFQTVVPTLMFTQKVNGKAEEAAAFYRSIFPGAEERSIQKRENGEVEHGEFKIFDTLFMMMDGGKEHAFTFTDGNSFVVNCKDQEEIDQYWNALTRNGGEEGKCGWLKDQYGLSWQIVPEKMNELVANPKTAQKVMEEVMKMKKLDWATLEKAYY